MIWRGPRKNGLIKQFLLEVNWGELDYLIIDSNHKVMQLLQEHLMNTYHLPSISSVDPQMEPLWSQHPRKLL